MSASGDLDELRRTNKELLEQLKFRCEKFRKCVPDEGKFETDKTSAGKVRSGSRQFPLDRHPNRDQTQFLFSTAGKAAAARKSLCAPIKPSQVYKPNALSSAQEVISRDAVQVKSAVICPPIQAHFDHNDSDCATDAEPEQYVDHLTDEGNIRNSKSTTPKSILLSTKSKDTKRDYGRVSFVNGTTEDHAEPWSVPPLLGYDWIAGLLEVNSPITNKSEEFFSDINEFRRVNKAECVHGDYSGLDAPDLSVPEDVLDLSNDNHECVYCYRVNDRLFTLPVGPESACPVCKKRRYSGYPGIAEPAYIRVSIPRATLLPPYKYKAHRRKSFDPTDSLALPSHCLTGWENAQPSCELNVPSLDLKSSVEPGAALSGAGNPPSMDDVSLYASRARSESLLNMSRSIHFYHGKAK